MTRVFGRTIGAALVVVLAACGSSSEPQGAFDASATSADLAAMQGAFGTGAFESFAALSPRFGEAAPLSASVASSAQTVVGAVRSTHGSGLPSAAAQSAARKLVATSALFQAAGQVIPDEIRGVTYVYADGQYVASELAGAPEAGVRFVLYAVNPVTKAIVEPLNEVGYADLIDESTEVSAVLRVVVVSGGTTYVNYVITGTPTENGGSATLAGFVTDGTTQANFTFGLSFESNGEESGTLSFDYAVAVPSRDFSLSLELTLANDQGTATGTLALELTGNGHTVTIAGTFSAGTGETTVAVDGEPFAVIHGSLEGEDPAVTGPEGEALTLEEQRALVDLFSQVDGALEVVDDLLSPSDSAFGL